MATPKKKPAAKKPMNKARKPSGKKSIKKSAMRKPAKKKSAAREVVLVTGAGGFVGRYVIEEALAQGYAVRATDLPGPDLAWAEARGVEVMRGDLTRREQVRALVRGVDHVAHIAAAFDLGMPRLELLRINLNGSVNLAEEAAAAGVRHFANCSTADTYGTHAEITVREDARQNPDNDYAFSKLLAEQAVMRVGQRRGMAVTTLRPTVIYGPGARYTASMFCTLPLIVHRRLGFFFRAAGGPLINAVHAEDVAGAVIFVLGKPGTAGEVFNVADDDWQTMGEYIHNIVEPLDVNWSPFTVPIPTAPLAWLARSLGLAPDGLFALLNRVLQSEWAGLRECCSLEPALNPRFDKGFLSYGLGDHAFDNSRLKAAGYVLRYPHFAAGYRETIRWYREQRWIPESALAL